MPVQCQVKALNLPTSRGLSSSKRLRQPVFALEQSNLEKERKQRKQALPRGSHTV